MRVHRQWFKHGELRSGCFKNLPDDVADGMSTDWSNYATPEETRQRTGKTSLYAVIALPVGQVRQIPEQVVRHAPLPDNRAHTLVFGPKGDKHPRIRLHYLRIARLVLPLLAE